MAKLGLFLAFFSLLLDLIGAQSDSTKLPPHWNDAPSDLSDYPQFENAALVNPWIYEQRQGLVKILLNRTFNKDLFGDDNFGNPLWGLALQLGWQFSSGRLTNSTKATCAISPYSWWGGMNFYLSVLPFFGAMKAGLFGDQRFEIIAEPKKNSELFCFDLNDCEAKAGVALEKWKDYFEKLETESDNEKVLKRLWQAHLFSLKAASPLMRGLAQHMSLMERRFGIDWAHFVEYVAAAAINADLDTTYDFQMKFLPRAVLSKEVFHSLPTQVRDGLDQLHEIYKLDKDENSGLSMWKTCMCSRKARRFAADVMAQDMDKGLSSMMGRMAELGWICLWESCDKE